MTHFVVIKSHHFLFVEVMFCLTSLASWCKVHLVTNMWAPSHLNATFKNLFFFPTSIVKSATPLPRVTTWFFYCLPGWLLLVPSVDVTSVFVPTTLLPYYFSQQNPQSANSCFIFFPHLINKTKQNKKKRFKCNLHKLDGHILPTVMSLRICTNVALLVCKCISLSAFSPWQRANKVIKHPQPATPWSALWNKPKIEEVGCWVGKTAVVGKNLSTTDSSTRRLSWKLWNKEQGNALKLWKAVDKIS